MYSSNKGKFFSWFVKWNCSYKIFIYQVEKWLKEKRKFSTIDRRLTMKADCQRDLQFNEDKKKIANKWQQTRQRNLKWKSYNFVLLSLAALTIRHCTTSTRSHLYKSSLFKRFASSMRSPRGFMCTVKWRLAGGPTQGLCATEDARKTGGAGEKIRDLLWTKTCFYP